MGSAVKTSESEGLEGTCQERKKSSIHLTEVKSRLYFGLRKEVYCLIKLTENYEQLPYMDILIILRKMRLDDVHSKIANNFEVRVGFRRFLQEQCHGWPRFCRFKNVGPLNFKF